ncbi:hypothetical protein CUR178_06124 [Leishmania enriettii]|uniref:Uncharacterized protein n=1 Tax=Leishmania enriettii TaxID=5663 RepID=A0A836GY26_LEIEN|nr:hypothetical protein CUR178_06082 [Leishmania enriettii]KAG5482264.1 hypothetical protein CUR178_06124 [Leishmania enriettii]
MDDVFDFLPPYGSAAFGWAFAFSSARFLAPADDEPPDSGTLSPSGARGDRSSMRAAYLQYSRGEWVLVIGGSATGNGAGDSRNGWSGTAAK